MTPITPPPVAKITLSEEYSDVVDALDAIETKLRVQAYPLLQVRPPFVRWKDETVEHQNHQTQNPISVDGSTASLQRWELTEFSLNLLFPPSPPALLLPTNPLNQQQPIPIPIPTLPNWALLTSLDVSKNKLEYLPGLDQLSNLVEVNLSQNYFKQLPPELGKLTKLTSIDASRCSLAPKQASLHFSELRTNLPLLRILNVSKNKLIGRDTHAALIRVQIPQLTIVTVSLWTECSVGANPADRDATLLRSRLEPLSTGVLRQRLVQDFGHRPTDPTSMDRSAAMATILACYHRETNHSMTDNNNNNSTIMGEEEDGGGGGGGGDGRHVLRVDGTPIGTTVRDNLLLELRAWRGDVTRGGSPENRERPSILASSYMILNSPDFRPISSRRAIAAAGKLDRNRNLWDLAMEAMRDVDPEFSTRCTELAVTFGFQGSPHIDRQNVGPFYGLALGEFPEGQGGVCVECSARVLAVMNTRNRLGRVDGRHVHWVEPYDPESERFSLIYYVTSGEYAQPGPAIFSIPEEAKLAS